MREADIKAWGVTFLKTLLYFRYYIELASCNLQVKGGELKKLFLEAEDLQ